MKGLIFFLIFSQAFAFAEAELEYIQDYEYGLQKLADPTLIKLEAPAYDVNSKASFCIRPIEMIDTITIHHSEGRSTDTPISINNYHRTRGSSSDPWYMIGYSYVINTPYEGDTFPKSMASLGRPLTYVGAHAGSNIYLPMDEVQQKIWDSKKEVLCGKVNKWVYDPTLVKNGKIKANVTTIGVVVVGNYSEFSGKKIRNSRGKLVTNPYPNLNGDIPAREPTDKAIDMIARLACQLQNEHKRIKNFSYHQQYHETSCPGSIHDYMKAIQAKAKEYGCEFKVIPGKYY